jgi:hypothetical protein
VSITKVREQLGDDVDQDEVTQVILDMARRGDGVHLSPDSDRRGLTQADHDAAVKLGREAKHLIAIEPPDDPPATSPAPASEPAAADAATPAAPVSGALSTAPLIPNAWDDPTKSKGIRFHRDGEIGTAIKGMGDDARMDIDGEPVANVLGRVATDVVTGQRTTAEGVKAYKDIRDRLPEGSRARRSLDIALMRIDAPASNPPDVPAGTPEPLKTLMRDLHSIPLLRRDPRETQKLQQILGGPIHIGRIKMEIERLKGMRHESEGDAGKFDVDRAVEKALNALDDQS